MISDKIKAEVLKEKDLDKALEILKSYQDEKWDEEIIKHLQEITPNDEIGIETFSYLRPNKQA